MKASKQWVRSSLVSFVSVLKGGGGGGGSQGCALSDFSSRVGLNKAEDFSEPARRNRGPRVVFMLEDDVWSMFPNPECSHDRFCGHKPRPRILFRPDGTVPDQPTSQSTAGTSLALPDSYTLPQTVYLGAHHGHTRGNSARRESKAEVASLASLPSLPSVLGPFLLESLSNASSSGEGCE